MSDTDNDDEIPTASATGGEDNRAAADENDPGQASDPSPAEADSGEEDRSRLVQITQWALFVILLLVMLVATFRFYFAASNAVNQFVTREYRSLFQALFNLGILLATGIGLSLLVRKLR